MAARRPSIAVSSDPRTGPPPGPRAPGRGLRERKRARTRQALSDAAWRLVEEHGIENVTADAIAEGADVSRSTFFRYFGSKEAVLFTWREPLLDAFEQELARREPAERGFDVVRRALVAIAVRYQAQRDEIVWRQAIINASPSLVGFEYEVDRRWEDAIAEALLAGERRSAAARRTAQLRAGAILGVVRVTLRLWIAQGGRGDLVRRGREALDLLDPDAASTPAARRRAT